MSQFLVRNADTMPPNISVKEPLTLKLPECRSTSTPKTNLNHTPKREPKPKPNLCINTPNSIKVQTQFMDAMTNAIIRYLDKHDDSTKTNAEQSVFVALGYDTSIESISDRNMAQTISHYRRHHIMRNRDAIRTFRIKNLHENVMQQYPHYNHNDVLIHLTQKSNSIYLPSPSPPPPFKALEPTNNTKNKANMESNKVETLHDHKEGEINASKSNTNSTQRNSAKCIKNDAILETAKNKIRNVNYTINQCPNDKQMMNKSVPNHNDNRTKKALNRVYAPSSSSSSSSSTSTSIAHNDRIRYKKKKIISCNKSGIGANIGYNQSIITKKQIFLQKTPYLVDGYPPSAYLQQSQHVYMMDDEVTQKIKLHKKSRKRKFTFNEFEQNSFEFDHKAPPKKRSRKDTLHRTHSVYASKGRGRGSSKPRSRVRTSANINSNIYHSTECFEDEEDEGSDIDLNEASQTTTNSHL